jgi:tRNA 2-selenouridine synthase
VPVEKIDINQFHELFVRIPVLDVRSPSEFRQAHIPGAVSFPLFTDEERRVIGTTYKQQSRESAIKIGLSAFGKNLVVMLEEAEKIIRQAKDHRNEVIVHCWRGGMRSAAVAWLLDLYGFKVYVITGGYKTWRRWALAELEAPVDLKILSGYTGSNKTGLINALMAKGISAIDLEGLAAHKGSSFGNLELQPQPTQEHFENLLAHHLRLVKEKWPGQPIWLEAESQRIGLVNIPFNFFTKMRMSPLLFIDVPFEERLKFIVKNYGVHDKDRLINAILRIKKKLGGNEAKAAVAYLMDDDVTGCFDILLKYYDKLYLKTTHNGLRTTEFIRSGTTDPIVNLKKLLDHEPA